MRGMSLILLAAVCTAGCAARLPLAEQTAPVALVEAPASYMTQVSAQRLTRTVVPVSEYPMRAEEPYEGPEAEEEAEREATIFLGYTAERGEGGFTIGFDYGHKVHEGIAVGPFVDYVAGDLHALAIGGCFFLRPFKRNQDVTFVFGAGIDLSQAEEEEHEGEESPPGGRTSKKWQTDFLLRIGVKYGFDLGRGFRFVPAFNWDIIAMERQAYVFGIELGKEF